MEPWRSFCCEFAVQRWDEAVGESPQQARKIIRRLKWRIERQTKLHKKYNDFTEEFINGGQVEKVPSSELMYPSETSYYLCHHCVFEDSSTTIKMRVAIDGSAETTTGISLNDRPMVGPKIQQHLLSIFVRLHLHHVALSARIAKMYRQVQFDTDDKNYQRNLWKNPQSETVKT